MSDADKPQDAPFDFDKLVQLVKLMETHDLTEVSLRQYSSGDSEKAGGMLKQIQSLAHKIHLSMAENDKRLKDSEILLRHTAFRLSEMLHSSSYEDRQLVEETLAEVNHAQSETMLQVFRK